MILLSLKIYSEIIIKIKAIKYKENFFYYLSSYLLNLSF